MRKILVIGTGGTISCEERGNGLEPAAPISELLKDINVPCEISTEQLFTLDSTNMTPRHWEKLAARIREAYGEFDGFVITHGTDTLGYAAAALSCLIQNPRKPIVLTGSMKPMSAALSDAPRNLRDALAFAADERAFGVRVVFGGKVFDGRCVSKTDTESDNAFFGAEVELSQLPAQNRASDRVGETRFCERLSDDVFLVKLIPGQKLCVPENTRVLILEGFGAGGVPDYLLEDVTRLSESGVYIIIATQCASGGTRLYEYEVGRRAAAVCPLLETGKMTVEYAVARAQWALACSDSRERFAALFNNENNEVDRS